MTIDNLDGAGARDYSMALSSDGPLTIERVRDAPSRSRGVLNLSPFGLPVPARGARVVVTNDRGATLFSGSVATQPERVYVGVGSLGPVYQAAFSAVSDESFTRALGGGITYVVKDGDAVVEFASLANSAVREIARDITASGELEPAAYITEYFLGDGTTDVFQLAQAPFHPANATLLDERFDQATINPQVWSIVDPGSFLALTSAGLTMTGGGGFDGRTTLTSNATIEMGGTLVIEANSVTLGAGSDGIVCGLYSGAVERGNCMAGFDVRQSDGATIVTPLVEGVEAGVPLTMLSGHRYTLRLRVHCPEMVRQAQIYSAMVDGDLRSFGGGAVAAPVAILFEARDMGLSSNTPATVLFTGSIVSSPGACRFAAVNCVEMFGAIGQCSITQAGSAWIVTTAVDGAETVRVTGAVGDGVDCMLSPSGRITFFDGRIPLPGERIAVMYRGRRRAVARLAEAGDLPATARWHGRVIDPPARTTEDCESAARSMLGFATSRAAAATGTCMMVNPANDLAPRDVLALTTASDTLQVLVRSVTIEDGHGRPELARYRLGFANDWAEGLGLRLSDTVASDALLPETAGAAPASVLANLPALQVVSPTGIELKIDAGVDAPSGGGFEVRRRDWAFGPGTDVDLVLRSPVRSFSIPREAQVERYYVRMYDGSVPPVYSRFSSAVFTNLPVSA